MGHAERHTWPKLRRAWMGEATAFPQRVVARSADMGWRHRTPFVGGRCAPGDRAVCRGSSARAVGQRVPISIARVRRLRGDRRRTAAQAHMPRQGRKPWSDAGRRSRLSSHSAAVPGRCSKRPRGECADRPGSDYRDGLDGYGLGHCGVRWLPLGRKCAAIRRPLERSRRLAVCSAAPRLVRQSDTGTLSK